MPETPAQLKRGQTVREALDALYATEDSTFDPILDRVQQESLLQTDW